MKYCDKCKTTAFDNQNYCQKCGNNRFVKSMDEFVKKEIKQQNKEQLKQSIEENKKVISNKAYETKSLISEKAVPAVNKVSSIVEEGTKKAVPIVKDEFNKTVNKVSDIIGEGTKKEKAKNIFTYIKDFITVRFVKFIKNYKKFKTLPKQSKIKHICFPVIILLVISIVANSSGGNNISSKTVGKTKKHNNGIVLTYCDEKRAYFDITYKDFINKFNSKITDLKLPYTKPDKDSALKEFKEMTVTNLIGQENLYSKLSDDVILCTTSEVRTSKDRSPFKSNLAGVYIIADYKKASIDEVHTLYKTIIEIINPKYSNNDINKFLNNIIPTSFSKSFESNNYDENIYLRGESIDNTNYSVFSISAHQSEELDKEIENYEFIDCTDSELKKAIKILQSNKIANSLGISNNLYYTILNVLGANAEITGRVDFYGNINVHFNGTYKGATSAEVIYKVSLDYNDYKFQSSSLDWDYVMSTYQLG